MGKSSLQPQLGQRIKEVRKSRLLTLEELGKRVGISNQALSAIERGRKNPSRQTLLSLSRELSDTLGVDWLEAQQNVDRADIGLWMGERYHLSERERLREAFNQFLTFKFGSMGFSEIDHIVKGMRQVPLAVSIKIDGTPEKLGGNDNLLIPASMTRPGKGSYGIRIETTIFADAFIYPGDVVISNDDINLFSGKVALVKLKGSLRIRRISMKGRSVNLMPLGAGGEAEPVTRKEINCLGEITGVIRVIE
jgi:transcriptional regulator with XRE-family HTH domain